MRCELKLVRFFMVVFLLLVAAGCSDDDNDVVHRTGMAGDESIYSAGIPLQAVGYGSAPRIELFRQTSGGGFDPVCSGDFFSGTVSLAVSVDPCDSGARVFISDGGGRQVEAMAQDRYHVAEFDFDAGSFRQALLVQVIYPDGTAARRKFVCSTWPGAGADSLVREGVLCMAGDELLDMLEEPLEGMINSMVKEKAPDRLKGVEININELGAPHRMRGNGILYMDLRAKKKGLLPVDFSGEVIVDDTSLTGKRGLFFDVEDGNLLGFLADLCSFFMKMDNPDLFASMRDKEDFGSGIPYVPAEFIDELLDRHLFLDFYGLPESCDRECTAFGAGLHLTSAGSLDGVPLHEHEPWDPGRIEPGDGMNFGMLLSQDGINQLISSMLEGSLSVSMDNPDVFKKIPYGDQLFGTHPAHRAFLVTIDPGTVAVDLRMSTPRLVVSDLRIEYLENDSARWEMSIDMDLFINATSRRTEDGIMLDIVPEIAGAHTHILRDNSGVSLMFDHSYFVQIVFGSLLAEPISINLSEALGGKVEIGAPLEVSSGDGYLGLRAAIDGVNLQ